MTRACCIFLLMLISVSAVFAEDQGTDDDPAKADIMSLRDPFETQFPQKLKAIDITVQPENYPSHDIAAAHNISQPGLTPDVPEKKFDPAQFQVNGVVWNTTRPQAIINNQVVNIGDIVNGAKIVSIQKTGIDFAMNQKIYTIRP